MAEAEVLVLDNPENYKVVKARIKYLWDHGKIFPTGHSKKRLAERGFDILDVKQVLFYGRIVDHSKPDALWRYVIKGKTIDGHLATCIVEINGNLIIITFY